MATFEHVRSRRSLCFMALSAALVATALGDASQKPPNSETEAKVDSSRALVRERNDELLVGLRGMAIQLHGANRMAEYRKLIDELADRGANAVELCVHAYQEHGGSTRMIVDPLRTPSDIDLGRLIQHARSRNLRVVLLPIVLLESPRQTSGTTGWEWRGTIEPEKWSDWLTAYRQFVLHYALVAASYRADIFVIGSELLSVVDKQPAFWLVLIKDVREVFPGKLTYEATWDRYDRIGFWKELDYVGMNFFHELAKEPGADEDSLVNAWGPIRRKLDEWQEQIGKPVLLLEVGYCSQEGCATEPWNYYHNQKALGGFEEQQRCYAAFRRAWGDAPWLAGVFWWEWTGDGGMRDTSYCPRGKPAEAVLRAFFADR